jgi:hypothetical protein
VFLEGVLRCILRRCQLLEQGRRKEGKRGAEEKVRKAWAETRETLAGPLSAENGAALHSMHCVITPAWKILDSNSDTAGRIGNPSYSAIAFPGGSSSQSEGVEEENHAAALHSEAVKKLVFDRSS